MKTFKSHSVSSMFAALAFLLGSSAMAATETADMAVSASVTNSCTITTDALGFGAYDPTSATATEGQGALRVTCTNGAALSIMMGEGANADAGSTADAPLRRMKDGANFLDYELFQDAGFTTTWGDSSNSDKTDTANGAEQEHTVFGRIAATQNIPAGAYADTVLATVSF